MQVAAHSGDSECVSLNLILSRYVLSLFRLRPFRVVRGLLLSSGSSVCSDCVVVAGMCWSTAVTVNLDFS